MLILLATVLFYLSPDLDIRFSTLFYTESDRFRGSNAALFAALRLGYIYFMVLGGLAALAMFFRSLAIGARREVPLRVWGFAVTSFLIGPLFLTNSILKTFWGRARPSEIVQFGGDKQFSLPWVISDQCDFNCSFVSGEGSALAAIMIMYWVLFWPNLPRAARRVSALVFLPAGLFGIALRIIVGGHFLSDSVFAILLMALVTWAVYGAFDMGKYRHILTWTRLKRDLSAQK